MTTKSRFGLSLILAALFTCAAAVMPACASDLAAPIPVDASGPSDVDAASAPDAAAPPAPGTLRVTAGAALRTGEDGTRATFTVALGGRPEQPVVVPVASANEGETKVDPSALTFTPDDWAEPKTVTLIGQNDDVADGDQQVAITLGPSSSADARYAGLRGEPINVTNLDDDTVGVETSTPAPSANTNEAGGIVTFSVRLRSKPKADVSIAVGSTRPSEGTADKTALVFTASTWNQPQLVTVTGKDDAIADGDQPYAITLAKAQSSDAAYAAFDPPDVALVNQDDDIPGYFVSGPTPSNKTTEAGATASFTVRLRSKPLADVSIPVSSSKPLEGTPSVTSLSFTPANYDQPQTVTVTGQDDKLDDDDQGYLIVLAAATSADASYAGLDPPDVALTNQDDDTASVLVSAPVPAAQTTEAGGKITFTVSLASQPTADVTIAITSSKPSEGQADLAQLVFTAGDWNVAQTVTVTGQDDAIDDGNVAYAIVLAKATSADAKYAAIDPADVMLTNVDDDTAGISVGLPLPDNKTSEGAAKASVAVVLQTQPTASVTIPVSVSKPAEGTPDVVQLVFTTGNWNVAQTVTVTGKDDFVDDGDQAYSLVLGAATSADGLYAGINPADVALTNLDDDTAGLLVSAPSPTNTTTEIGGQITITVSLQSQPLANVTVAVASTTMSEGKSNKAQLVFTAGDWNVAQTVTVTGQADGVDDGDQAYSVSLGASTSVDPLYAGLTGSVALVNEDACGNGAVDGAEQCDDSNATKCDGCESCERRRWATLPANASASVAGITAALPRGDLCVEAWAKIGALVSGDAILLSSYGAGNNGAFLLRCANGGGNTGHLVFAHEAAGPVVSASVSNTACADGAWHHFAGCRSVVGATVTNTVFLDGVLKATASGAATTIGANATLVFGGVTYVAEGLAGAIDEVRISNVVRYTANFVPVRRHVADASTVALWHLDEGTGTTFADASGNAYTGTLTAGAGWATDTGYNVLMCQ